MVKPRLRPLKGGFWYAYGQGTRATGIGITGAYRQWMLQHRDRTTTQPGR